MAQMNGINKYMLNEYIYKWGLTYRPEDPKQICMYTRIYKEDDS